MAQSKVLRGADIIVYISGVEYPAESIMWNIDYGEQPIYGIDSVFPQEIAITKCAVQGTVSGVRVKLGGGLQGAKARSKINELLQSPYTSLLIKDRHSDINLLWVPQMKVSSENFRVNSKNTARLTFNFQGIIPYNPLDIYA